MKKLWYIAQENLSREGYAGTIHSREDVKELRKFGWRVKLFGKADKSYKPPDGVNEIIVQTINPYFAFFYHLLFELKLILLLIKAEEKPDFVFFRGPSENILFGIYLRLMKYPFGMELNGVFKYRYDKIGNFHDLFQLICDRFFFKNCKIIITVTEELKDLARNESKSDCIISVARNGVNHDIIKPCLNNRKNNIYDFKIGYLGKCYIHRGHELALETVAKLKKINYNIGFTFVGGGPNVNKLKEMVNNLEIYDQIEFIDEVPQKEVGNFIADCDLMWAYFDDWYRYRLTGLSPLKIWTYLSLGKPVIVRDPGGLLDHYKNVPGIFYYNGENDEGLSKFILEIWEENKKEGLKKIGVEARKHIKKNISWKKHAKIIDESLKGFFRR